jgi:hypothetical protein
MNEQPKALTKRDLAELGVDALDKAKTGGMVIARTAGGVRFASALEVMEFAKLMSIADKAVPKHLRLNAGACLRIVFQSVEWEMSPWAVADKSYEVSDRIAYESQLIHAVVEARAPLKERLQCAYDGEGVDRWCIITGHFTDGTSREYASPKIKDIKVKNSPLWTSDPDQQLFYYASRAWARKWVPDVIMGLYTKEELREDPTLGRPDEEEAPGLRARLVGSNVDRSEGHQDGQVERELSAVAESAGNAADGEGAEAAQNPRRSRKKKNESAPAAVVAAADNSESAIVEEGEATEKTAEAMTPKNPAEWQTWCRVWLSAATDPEVIKTRWARERQLRNSCGVTQDEREPMMVEMAKRIKELDSAE